MNKKGLLTGVLLVLVIIVVTSAVILLLVKTGTIEVKEVSSEPILNAEFLPVGRVGSLAITEFRFCSFIDEDLNCFSDRERFYLVENVYVRFVVETSTYNGDVLLVRNYRIKDPSGKVVLELDQSNDYDFEMAGGEKIEPIVFADFFVMDHSSLGEYTLEVIVINPLLDKTITVTRKFELVGEEVEV
jgi:hypothetical protein